MSELLPRFEKVTTVRPWPEVWRTWAGATNFATGWIYLHPLTFESLSLLERTGRIPKERVARIMLACDIDTLAHELQHRNRKIRNEVLAEKGAKHTYVSVARRLGVGPVMARRLLRLAGPA